MIAHTHRWHRGPVDDAEIQRFLTRLATRFLARFVVVSVASTLVRFHRGGGPWGGKGFRPDRGGFGPHGRRFERGDLKYVILDLLQEEPRHGYDIIRALEERAHGFYSPSPGSIYPTLQLLEDQGYVTSVQQDGKRVYAITEAGRAFLLERADTVEDLRKRMRQGWGRAAGPELGELMGEMRSLGQFLFQHASRGELADPEKIRQLRDVVRRAHADIQAIFSDESSPAEVV